MATTAQDLEACPACSQSILHPTAIRGQPFSICAGCEFVFANPVPHDTSDSATVYLTSDIDSSTAVEEVEKQKARLRQLERFRSPPGALLDIGSGPGYLVKAAQEMGWRAAGCELSEACCKFGRDVLGVPLFATSFDDLPQASGIHQADVITAYHVVEHLPVPKEFVSFAARTLAPGGLVLVEIPNLFSFESLQLGEAWHGLALPAHVGFHTPKSLTALFEPEFRITLIEYSIAPYYYEKIAPYLERMAISSELIDRSARQFSGTALVAYIERADAGNESSSAAAEPKADALPRRAVRKLWRTLRRPDNDAGAS
jgi:SAM-dependent methyltransferase